MVVAIALSKMRAKPLRIKAVLLAAAALCGAWAATGAAAQARPEGASACMREFVGVRPALPACDFTLGDDGTLNYAGRTVARPLVVSYEDGGGARVPIGAKQVVVFPPSPTGRFRVLQACDGTGISALCWSVFAFDTKTGRLRQVDGGKYGPDRWQSWSPDGQRVVLASHGEGAAWLHVVDPASGKTRNFPGNKSKENWTIQPESLKWIGARSFTVTVKTCQTCEARRKTIQF
jgi:hypothetical protein